MGTYTNRTVAFLLVLLLALSFSGCAFKSVVRSKNIVYQKTDAASSAKELQLNVFAPRKPTELKNVLIYIHGGNWNSGKKSLYSFFGNRLARKGVVAVTIDYPLSPEANYNQMAIASAKAIEWVKNNIKNYGGNSDKIFVSGHSAGGHLAALISIRGLYFDSLKISNPVNILIDAAGLDMFGYLQESKFKNDNTYIKTFTPKPELWKAASPLYHIHKDMPPMLIYKAEKTYPSIEKSHVKFIKALNDLNIKTNYSELKGKKHVPMITQFLWTWNPRYDEILEFMDRNN